MAKRGEAVTIDRDIELLERGADASQALRDEVKNAS